MRKLSGKRFALLLALFLLTFAVAIPTVSGQPPAYDDPSWQVATELIGTDPVTGMRATVTTTNDWEWGASFRWYGPYTTEGEVDALIALGVWQTTLTPAYTTDDLHSGSPQTTFVSEITWPSVAEAVNDVGWWYIEVDCHGIEGGQVYPHVAFGKLHLPLDSNPVPWFTSLPLALLATLGGAVLIRRKVH